MKKRYPILMEGPMPGNISEIEMGLTVKRWLYKGKSLYQKIEVIEAVYLGRVLVLDGIFQTSEKEELTYHEMICHLPMFYHPNPKKILIIGGGDGGTLEEILKHPIEKVWMVEIDKKVIEVCKKYLPFISKGAFEDKRSEIIISDGWQFVKKYKDFFDIIILDLSDPWGPAKDLISLKFYQDIKKALRKKGGVISIQSGNFFIQPKIISAIYKNLKKASLFVKVHRGCVPLYGVGEFSFIIAANFNLKTDFKNLQKRFNKFSLETKYYSPEIHLSSEILPKFLRDLLKNDS